MRGRGYRGCKEDCEEERQEERQEVGKEAGKESRQEDGKEEVEGERISHAGEETRKSLPPRLFFRPPGRHRTRWIQGATVRGGFSNSPSGSGPVIRDFKV